MRLEWSNQCLAQREAPALCRVHSVNAFNHWPLHVFYAWWWLTWLNALFTREFIFMNMKYWRRIDWETMKNTSVQNRLLKYATVKGILWDRRWSTPSIRIIFPTHADFFTEIMKLSNPPSFRAIRALIASQSTFEI